MRPVLGSGLLADVMKIYSEKFSKPVGSETIMYRWMQASYSSMLTKLIVPIREHW